jgi:hypothetical protein
MGYTATREQRVQILVAIRRMAWSECRPDDHTRYLTSPALRAVAATVLGTAATGCGHERSVCPLRRLVRVGVAQLPSGRRVIGLDDGATRQYVLDLGSEAISVLIEPNGAPTPRHSSDTSLTERDDRQVRRAYAPDFGASP